MAIDNSPLHALQHPLDALSEDEIARTTSILRSSGRTTSRMRIMAYSLHEPAKGTVLSWAQGQPFTRTVDVIIRDHERRLTVEAQVSLGDSTIISWDERGDIQPALTYPEVFEAMQATYDDAAFQQAIARRGISDLASVSLFPWTNGHWGPEDDAERGRFLCLQATLSKEPEDNYYARPLEGIKVTIELDNMTVKVDDFGVVPIPKHSGNYTVQGIRKPGNVPHFPNGTRTDLKPIEITQPEGVSFQVDGNRVSWQKWRFLVGFSPREGLVLHLVEYFDQDRWRSILYRASLDEMYVPYGDASLTHNFKNVLDTGEVGIGVLANSLEPGCDCLGVIHYFDACVNDAGGQPSLIKNAICLHEEDYGLLWKHLEYNADGSTRVEVRRSRRLVISMIATVGNYEYGFYWYLYQDGSMQFEVKLTGIIAPAAITPDEQPVSGTLVAPGLYGPNHQHFFNVRLDWMLEGLKNSLVEVNCESLPPGPQNPRGNAWAARETLLATEAEAQRCIEPRSSRYWKIINPNVHNTLGQPVAYKLVPESNVFPLFHEGSPQCERGGFVRSHLWGTQYDARERFAGGDYPNQRGGGDGLPTYVQQNRSLVNTNVVTWYTFGSTHVPRSEDWPVMPVDMVGFYLKPLNFFVGNPALDVHPPMDHCNHTEK